MSVYCLKINIDAIGTLFLLSVQTGAVQNKQIAFFFFFRFSLCANISTSPALAAVWLGLGGCFFFLCEVIINMSFCFIFGVVALLWVCVKL